MMNDTDDILNNPKSLNLRQQPKAINQKTLSKIPLTIIGLVVVIFLLGVIYALSSRVKSTQQASSSSMQQQSTNQQDDANSIVSSLKKGGINHAQPHEENNDNALIPAKALEMNIKNEHQERIDNFKLDVALKAITSTTQTGITTPPHTLAAIHKAEQAETSHTQVISQNPVARGDTLKSMQGLMTNTVNESSDERTATFMARSSENGYLERIKIPQMTPYEIKAGWLIPATLLTAINSELQGSVLAQVSENVYDSATGQHLLIPQGSKLLGQYSANIIYGQNRLLVAWNRIIFPDGATLTLDNMSGHSMDGSVGFEDIVDNHYFKIFGSALLMSTITAGITISSESENQYKETTRDKIMAAAIQQLGQVGIEMIRKNMNIAPTLHIRSGYKFNVFVTKDIILEPIFKE